MPLTPNSDRVSGWPLRWAGLMALGALAGLGQAPFDLPFVAVPAFGVALWLQASGGTRRAAFGRGFAFGVGYFALTLHWIVQPFLVDAAATAWMAPFALVFLAGGLGLFWAGVFAAAHWLRPMGRPAIAALVAVWCAEEMLRSTVFTGFPWVLPGHIWINAPQAELAALIGQHGLGLLTFGCASALVLALDQTLMRVTRVFSAVWVLAFTGLPYLPVSVPEVTGPDAPVIRIVQPNAPQDQKFDPDHIPVFLNRLLTATGADPAPDLVVWPETAMPYLLEWSDDILMQASDLAHGVPVVTGINRRDGDRYFNTLVVTGQGGAVTAVYDKEHLVPFGEYVPFGEVLTRFGINGLAASQGGGFSAGAGRDLIDIPGIGRARALICYEASFAEEILAAGADRPDVLVLVTNDAWFGTFAGPYQHLAHARLRAIEFGLPLIRSANTGISALIDGHGRILDSLPIGQAGHLDIALPPPLPPTLYSRTGDWPMVAFVTLWLGLLLGGRRKQIDPGPLTH